MVNQAGPHRIPTTSNRGELTLDQKGLSVCFLKNKKEQMQLIKMIQNRKKQDEIQKQNNKLYDRLHSINKKNTNVSKLIEANEIVK